MTVSSAKTDTAADYDSLDIAKLICSLMVVIIHTKPLQPYSDALNVYTAESICRIAVPFFFVASGLLLYTKLIALSPESQSNRRKLCLTQVAKNASLYLRWSVLYFFINLFLVGATPLSVL